MKRKQSPVDLLFKAIRENKPRSVAKLLREGVHPNAQDAAGFTALQSAALRGSVGVMRELLKGGADPNACDASGGPMLSMPCHGGHLDALELLVEAGTRLDEGGAEALAVAVRKEHTEMAIWLIGRGVRPSPGPDQWGASTMARAVEHGLDEVVDALLASGVLVDETALTAAVHRDRGPLLARMLASPGALGSSGDRGFSALVAAATRGSVEAARALLDAGASQAAPEGATTPLHEAAAGGHMAVVELLLARGADAKAKQEHGYNARSVACIGMHDEVAARLAREGAPEQPELASEIAEGRAAEQARRAAATSWASRFKQSGVVTSGPFAGMRGAGVLLDDGRFEVRLSVFGRETTVVVDDEAFERDP